MNFLVSFPEKILFPLQQCIDAKTRELETDCSVQLAGSSEYGGQDASAEAFACELPPD